MQAQPACDVRTFSIRDGLPANAITSIKQAPNGLIWLATWNGLCCYDGYHFTTFRGDAWGSDNALSTNRLAAIMPDTEGNVWVRTYDGGLYLFDTHQCRYVNIGLQLQKKYGETPLPRNFYSLPTGHTWITDENGHQNLRIDDKASTDVNRIEVVSVLQLRFGLIIRKVETDDKGHEWLITEKGMMRWDNKQTRPGVFSNYPEKAWKDSRGRSWNYDNTLVWTEDRHSTVWQINRSGLLSYYDEQAGKLKAYTQLTNYDKWFKDSQGNVWLYSSYGLTQLAFRYNHIQHLPIIQGQETRSLLCHPDGTTWAGTRDGHIAVFKGTELKGWLSPQGKITDSKVRFSDRIYVMKEDSKGRIWIGTKGQGLFVIEGGTVRHYMPDTDNRYALNNANIYDIDEDEKGNIWIATFGGGVNLIKSEELKGKSETLRFLNCANELKLYPGGDFLKVRRITHDGRGTMLLSCTTGLLTCSNQQENAEGITFYATHHRQDNTTSLQSNDVMQTLITKEGAIYVTTLGGGIQLLKSDRLLGNDLALQSVKALNEGLGNALAMLEDQQGTLWIVRETELCSYLPESDNALQYNLNGLGSTFILTEAQPAIDKEGRIWIGCMNGVITFKVKDVKKSQFRPTIAFSSVLYQGDRESHPILNRQELTVQPEERSMTIHFAALDFDDNFMIQYAYKLDAKDDDKRWNYIGNTPHLAFSQLSPGRHTLTIKSTNCEGIWANNETTLVIDVIPMFWERDWVRLLTLLLVIGFTTWAVIVYLRHRQHSHEREQRLATIMRQYRELQEQSVNMPTGEEKQAPADGSTAREYHLAEPVIVNPDEEMMTKLMVFIEKRLSDEELRIEEMAEAVGLGRTVFYSKIKELVGVSPSDFLRQVRMERALQLVAKSKMSVSEVAYSVGFTDPKYFTKCFKKQTGMTPSEYRDIEKLKEGA